MSAFQVTLEQLLPKVKGADGFIQTGPFLDLCRQVLPVVDKLGTAFALVKTDIGGNIERLSAAYQKDPERYERLFTIIQDEVVAKGHTSSTSCAKGLLWLKRAMEFITALLDRLQSDTAVTLSTAVSETYNSTLCRFHGFLVSSAFTLAFKFVPTREDFLQKLGPQDSLMADMKAFTTATSALLTEVHTFLAENNLDEQSKV